DRRGRTGARGGGLLPAGGRALHRARRALGGAAAPAAEPVASIKPHARRGQHPRPAVRLAAGRALRLHRAPQQPVWVADSKWLNPFVVGQDGDRATVIRLYREYLAERADLLEDLDELRGKTLVCWCAPEACHGDVLRELLATGTQRESQSRRVN